MWRFALVAAVLVCGPSAHAQTFTWAQLTTGTYDWNSSGNWSSATSGTFPNAAGVFANMYVDVTAPTINLNQQVTVGSLLIGDSGTAGGSTMTIQPNGGSLVINSGTAGVAGSITSQGGNQSAAYSVTVNADIALASDLALTGYNRNETSPLTVNGAISEIGGPRNVSLATGGSQKFNLVLNGASTYTGTTSLASTAWVRFNSIKDVGGGASALGAPTTASAGAIRVGSPGTALDAYLYYTGTAAASTDRQINVAGNAGAVSLRADAGLTLTSATPFTWSGTTTTAQTLALINVTVNGVIGDLGGPTSITSGANEGAGVTLLGLNTFTGNVGGIGNVPFTGFTFNSIADIGQASALGMGSGANAPIILGGATDKTSTMRYIGTGHASNRPFVIAGGGAGGTIEASGAGPLQLSGSVYVGSGASTTNKTLTLSGSGIGSLSGLIASATQSLTVSLAKSGDGIWTLSGANTFTGTTNINRGVLTFGSRAALYGGTAANWTQALIRTSGTAAATLGLGVGGTAGFTNEDITTLIGNLGTGTVSAGGMRASSSWGFDTTNTGSTFTVADTIANTTTGGGAIGVVKLGSGTLALSGTNTYTYGTRIDGGVLTITNTAALGAASGFLTFNGGTLDLAGLTLTRSGAVTATGGGLANGVLNGTFGLTKTGTGTFRITTGSNTFTGATSIQEGVVEAVALAASGVASSLGTGTGANATINLGNAATSGTFRYIGSTSGTMSRTLNLSGSSGGGGIDASGEGALVISSAVTATGAGAKTLTLGGTSTAANAIGEISNGSGTTSVVKDGPGLWRINAASGYTGSFTLRNGTLVAAADSTSTNGAFGAISVTDVFVGDSSPTASGSATLLLGAGVRTDKVMNVQAGGGSQAVVLGGEGSSADFLGAAYLGRPVTLLAAAGGTTTFSGGFFGPTGSPSLPAVNITIGSAGNTGVVSVKSMATTGTVGVQFGTLSLKPQGQDALGRTTPVSIGAATAGATLDLNGSLQTLANLSFTGIGGTLNDLAGSGTLVLANAGSAAAVGVTGTGHVISAPVSLDDTATFTVASQGRLAVGGVIADGTNGARGLVKTGAGTLVLGEANTFTGTTTVAAGTLRVGNGGTSGSVSGMASLALTGGQLVIDRSDAFTQAFTATVISGNPSVAVNAGNTVNFGALTTLPGAVFDIPTTGSFITSSPNVDGILPSGITYGGTTWAVASGTSPITGLGSASYTPTTTALDVPANYLAKNVDVDSSPSLTGPIAANTLRFATATPTTLGLSGASTVAGGILVTPGVGGNASAITGGSLAGTGGSLVVSQNNTAAPLSIGAVIADDTAATGLTKAGAGLLALTAANTYTAATTISAGTLAIGAGGATGSVAGDIVNNAVLAFNRSDAVTYAGVVSGAGSLVKQAGGTLAITSANTYTGTTQIDAGVLQVGAGGAAGALASSAAITGSAGGTLAFNRSNAVVQGTDFPGSITGAIGLTQAGSGTLTLSGTNTFSGPTRAAAGRLNVSGGLALQNSMLDMNATDSGTVAFGQNSTVGGLTGSRNLDLAGNTLSVGNNGTNTTYSGVLSGGALTKVGAGRLTLTGSNTYAGATTVSGGTLAIGDGGTTGSITGNVVNNAALAFNRSDAVTFANAISGSGSLVKQGAGTLTLSGSSTYSGGTLLSAGQIIATNNGALGTGLVTLAGGGLQVASDVTLTAPMQLTAANMDVSVDYSPLNVEYLVVGGGGGGGTYGGGGGGGGYVPGSSLFMSGSYSVTVGGGGAPGVAGQNSVFGTVVANGGGAGGANGFSGGAGASGGGGGGGGTTVGGTTSVLGQGNVGGNSAVAGAGGGGGGAGGPGSAAVATTAGRGGAGTASLISGTTTSYGGGGGGGAFTSWTSNSGQDGGGNGSNNNVGGNGTDSRGGGGGGGGVASGNVPRPGGNGGSGVVILRYLGGQVATGGTVTTGSGAAAGYTLHTFTTVGTTSSSSTFTIAVSGSATFSGAISGTGGFLKTGANTLILSASNSFSGTTTVSAGSLRLGHAQALGKSTFAGGAGSLSFGGLTAATFGGLAGSSALALSNTAAAAVALSIGANDRNSTYSGILSGAGSLTKIGAGMLSLSGSNTFSGPTTVNTGTLAVDGRLASAVTVQAGGVLGGSGRVASTLAGTGLVAPGNSPGILTADSLDPTLGLDLAFEFTGAAPLYTTATSSINDILRLTGTAPFAASLSPSINTVSLYLPESAAVSGGVFEGGFFSDLNSTTFQNFATLATSGSIVAYYQSTSGTVTYNGLSYALLSEVSGASVTPGTTTVASAGFSDGTVTNGQVTTFTVVVPEPGTLALAAFGLGLAGYAVRRRRLP